MKGLFILLFFTINTLLVFAQDDFPNTLSFSETVGSPKTGLQSISWIEGHWRGEAFGGITEEVWTPPLGGSMMGAFKLVVHDTVKFYELCTIVEKDSSLILKIKHFHADLKGWEPQDESQDFRLVKVSLNKIWFDGFTFERVSKNEINIYVIIQYGQEKKEVKFNYKKIRE